MRSVVCLLCAGVAIGASPDAVAGDVPALPDVISGPASPADVDDAQPRTDPGPPVEPPTERIRPLLLFPFAVDARAEAWWYEREGRSRLRICSDTGFRCSILGLDWAGTVQLMPLDDGRKLVATGSGIEFDNGWSTAEQILTAGIRQALAGRAWIQVGAGAAKREKTFAQLGRYDSWSEFLPAASLGFGVGLVARPDLHTRFVLNSATSLDSGEHSIYYLNAGFAGSWR